jgi:hypothetical protein
LTYSAGSWPHWWDRRSRTDGCGLRPHSMCDFTFSLMLDATDNVVIAGLIWSFWRVPNLPAAAALSVLRVNGARSARRVGSGLLGCPAG